MIRPLVQMPLLLQRPSTPATIEDLAVAQDLQETLEAHKSHCAGLAANMIGVTKRIIAIVGPEGETLVMLNPEIVTKSGEYSTEEGCLSLPGTRPCTRYKRITVEYLNDQLKPCKKTFTGTPAQAIQHELDHCNGILI